MFDVFVLGSCAPALFGHDESPLLSTHCCVSYVTCFCSLIKQSRTCNNFDGLILYLLLI